MNIQIKTLILSAAIMTLAVMAQAQTNVAIVPPVNIGGGTTLQNLWDTYMASTNMAFAAGGGRGLTASKNLVFADYLYNFNQNAGLVIGYDYLWGNHQSSANVVKGGLNLQTSFAPLGQLGFTNIVLNPFASYLVATPTSGTSNDGGLGGIAIIGVDWKYNIAKDLYLHAGGFFENRTGQEYWNGNYLAGHVALSFRF